jgi:Zn-dependent M28 family amino/carboxypeptidase
VRIHRLGGAHHDHNGYDGDIIYNGADDNASGTAALLALGEHFRERPLRHSLLLVAVDAEEKGIRGARAWVADPPIALDSVVMNVNLDMISRSEAGELYAAGTYHYPFLAPLVEKVARTDRLTLLTGHDEPDLPPGEDWTMASDHAAFHEVGIPFIYFGVEDHAGYHHPSDTFQNITPEFYVAAVETALDFLLAADREGEAILRERAGQAVGTR